MVLRTYHIYVNMHQQLFLLISHVGDTTSYNVDSQLYALSCIALQQNAIYMHMYVKIILCNNNTTKNTTKQIYKLELHMRYSYR